MTIPIYGATTEFMVTLDHMFYLLWYKFISRIQSNIKK